MENYAPFLAKHWQTIGLVGATLATGALVGQLIWSDVKVKKSQNEERLDSSNKKVTEAKRRELPDEDSAEDDNQDYEEDAPGADEDNAMQVVFQYSRPSEEQSILMSEAFYNKMSARRSVRTISSDPVPLQVIENIIKTAGASHSVHSRLSLHGIIYQRTRRDFSEWGSHSTVDLCSRRQPGNETADSCSN